jgi:hypothetical protein
MSAKVYTRSLSSLGKDSSRENDGSLDEAGAEVEGLLCDAGRGCAGASGGPSASSMVVSEEPLLPTEERDRERGVEGEAILYVAV